MQIIVSESFSPSFNLASEQFLLTERQHDVLFFYINSPCVVLGRNQNAYAEANLPFCREQGITVIRRLSGGGAVYHDNGTINFCFITRKENQPLDHDRLAEIEEALDDLGITTTRGDRKDLYINQKKISGTALHCTIDNVLFHGTLLYNTNLNQLQQALSPSFQMESKAVKSVKSDVTNIIDAQSGNINRQSIEHHAGSTNFLAHLLRYFSKKYSSKIQHFTPLEKHVIQELQTTRYDTWDWNFGQSPKTTLHQTLRYGRNSYTLTFKIEKGQITEIQGACPSSLKNLLLAQHADKLWDFIASNKL
ncbi:lipoate--protein ligase family protein [Microbacter margulisiae]|uniref:Lipoate-protein ligase A n=1 Tax=Microbacter margulisiae TaxID=1350067 RepID=A0A7W5H1T7_9PORP|nr:lipoate--protein ligase [Microbacter margulisiae]MBB3186949.1 lipoate-protein ligase A [Microbacter margulisiae]